MLASVASAAAVAATVDVVVGPIILTALRFPPHLPRGLHKSSRVRAQPPTAAALYHSCGTLAHIARATRLLAAVSCVALGASDDYPDLEGDDRDCGGATAAALGLTLMWQ